jgi:hypothetical protein
MIFALTGGLFRVSRQLRGEHVMYVDATDCDPDAVTMDMLARFALEARRCGYRLVLRGASAELARLIEFAGLSAALPLASLSPGSTPPRC